MIYRSMFALKILLGGLILFVLTMPAVFGETATQEEMALVSRNWLSYMVSLKGGWGNSPSPVIGRVQDIIVNDTLLGRCYEVEPSGYIVVPILKELAPIKAYSEDSRIDFNDSDGFAAMLKEVLQDRVRLYVDAYGNMEVPQPANGKTLYGSEQRAAWDKYLLSPQSFDEILKKGSLKMEGDLGPLLTTTWHQGAPYNNLCPWGDGNRTVVGCVATATAQILAYYKWPLVGLGKRTCYWMGDNSCGGSTPASYLSVDLTDPYDWDNIKNYSTIYSPQAEQDAVAELCYEVGVAENMMYGACGSGAYMFNVPTALVYCFRYVDSIRTVERSNYTLLGWSQLIQGEIAAGRPIQYAIARHSIVADGWRMTEPFYQVHMNYGWADGHTAWYTIDSLYCPWEGCNPMVEEMVVNIKPDRDVQFTADTTIGFSQLDVKFSGSSLLPADQWIWDFGDGDSAFVQSPEHTYDTPGRFETRLSVVSGSTTKVYDATNFVTVIKDSLNGTDHIAKPDSSFAMTIFGRNTVPVRRIQIPIQYGGGLNLILDSISTTGCRTDYFDYERFAHDDPINYRATITLTNYTYNTDLGTYDLEPGSGPILKVYFTIPGTSSPDDSSLITFSPYMTYAPMYYSSILNYSPTITSGEISMAYLCGDANGSGTANALDITHLINYLYKHGDAPSPVKAGDLNGSGGVNALDITYFINYLYKHGPAPHCP